MFCYVDVWLRKKYSTCIYMYRYMFLAPWGDGTYTNAGLTGEALCTVLGMLHMPSI